MRKLRSQKNRALSVRQDQKELRPITPSEPHPAIMPDTSEEEHDNIDALVMHQVASYVHQAWKRVYTVDQVAKLASVTFSLIENRRKLLQRPYALKDTSDSKRDIIIPLP